MKLAAAQAAWEAARLWVFGVPRLPERPVERVLVLGYAAIGDLLFFMPVLAAMRTRWPKARIVWVANSYPTTQEYLPATGLVDDIWLHDWEGGGGRRQINRRVAAGRFDLAVLTLSSPAHYFAQGLKTIPLRAGHLCRLSAVAGAWGRLKRGLVTGEFARRALLNRVAWAGDEAEHALSRNLRLLEALGVSRPKDLKPPMPIPQAARDKAKELLPGDSPWVGVHLGASGGAYGKMWAPERFGALCRELAGRWRARFVLVGAATERESARAACREYPQFLDLVGATSLWETFAVIERCRFFISSDTGLAKAAMALGVRAATVWGPSDPAEYGSAWEADVLDIRTGISCSPCSRMGMPRLGVLNYLSCGHHDCLARLDIAAAREAIFDRFGEVL